MQNPIDELIARKGVLLADGATGTNLFAMGLSSGEAPELWNETAPEKIGAQRLCPCTHPNGKEFIAVLLSLEPSCDGCC